jgi:ABC transporter substrate binding protein (PQQ-dependent alcohol dehydrogenase system)
MVMRWMAAVLLLTGLPPAAPLAAAPLPVAYLELADDPRYDQGRMESRVPGQPWGRPFAGAEVAALELRFPLMAVDMTLELQHRELDGAAALQPVLAELAEAGVDLVMLDLPGELVRQAAAVAAEQGQIVFNVSASDDALRGEHCRRNLFHLIPSDRMRMDGLAQYLVERDWREVLLLTGPEPADARVAEAFRTAAERYGLELVEERAFVSGSDPRQREANNLDLLTRGGGFDVIFIADADAEFARQVPYSTRAPRPVVGSGGLMPTPWHWNWQRHGAVQLNNRFVREAERGMGAYDWAAWIGIKAIGEAALRTRSTEASVIADYLRGDELVLDGFQGYRLSFRDWNNQLRSAIFLASPDWVAGRAPLEGFMHPTNDLDSLGLAEAESDCAF